MLTLNQNQDLHTIPVHVIVPSKQQSRHVFTFYLICLKVTEQPEYFCKVTVFLFLFFLIYFLTSSEHKFLVIY